MRRTDRLAEERDGRIPVARGPEQEIQRVTVGINAPVKIVPGPADTHVRLVDSIRIRGASQKWPAPLVDLRRIALHPSIDRRMVDTQAPLAHHFFEVAVTHGIPQVPPNTQEDESWFELTPLERIVAGHDGDPVQSLSKTVHPEVAGPKLQQNLVPESSGNELQLLNELVSDLELVSSVQEVCDTISRYLMLLMPSTLCVFYLYDSENDELVAQHASSASSEKAIGLRVRLGHCLSGWVGSNRSTIRNSDPTLDFGDRVIEFRPAPHSCLSSPLVADGNLVGVLSLYAPERNAFSEDHHRVIEVVSTLASQVLQHAAESDASSAVELVGPPSGRFQDQDTAND